MLITLLVTLVKKNYTKWKQTKQRYIVLLIYKSAKGLLLKCLEDNVLFAQIYVFYLPSPIGSKYKLFCDNLESIYELIPISGTKKTIF